MRDKDVKDNNKNKSKAGSSSLPFEIRERTTRSSHSSAAEEREERQTVSGKKGLKQLSAQKNLTQC